MVVNFFQRQRDVLQRGKMRKQIKRLENRSDGAPVFHQKILFEQNSLAIDFQVASVGKFQTSDDSQQSGFSTARRPDQNQRVDFFQIKRYTVQSRMTIELFCDLIDAQFHVSNFTRRSSHRVQSEIGRVKIR